MQKRLFLTPLAIILFIMYFTVFGDRGLLRINHLHRDLDDMQQSLKTLQVENEKLRGEIEALQSDRRYLESIARRDFGLVRSNEVVYQFSAPHASGAASPGAGAKGEAQRVAGPQTAAPQPAAPPVAAQKPALQHSAAQQPAHKTGAQQPVPGKKGTQQPGAKPAASQNAAQQ